MWKNPNIFVSVHAEIGTETMSIRLIIFDFDGTLGDTRRNIVTTMQMTIEELHLPNRSEEE